MIFSFKQFGKLVFIFFGLSFSLIPHPSAVAAEPQKQVHKKLADEVAPPAAILAYKKASFAPSRDETFSIPIEIKQPETVKQLVVEIRTADDDLIQTLKLADIVKDKTKYELKWDGRDQQNQLIPNEAYIPILIVTDTDNRVVRTDSRNYSGGEEIYDFDKSITPGTIEFNLPMASRILIRSGIINGPMLRTIIDWQPRTAGFHAERWSGRDLDDVIGIEQNPQVGYLIIGYELPDHSIITYGNKEETYRGYRERKKLPQPLVEHKNRSLERGDQLIRPEFYTPILQQKSPRISVTVQGKTAQQSVVELQGMDEILTKVKLHPLDEMYLDQERYEISFFVDNEFIAEEEQGFVPFTWRWSPGRYGIKPGKHILTVNVSGYNGQMGVRNLAFILREESGAHADTKEKEPTDNKTGNNINKQQIIN